MSSASTTSQATHRRIDEIQHNGRLARNHSGSRQVAPPVTEADAYSFALRTAYLQHLLEPKLKRLQHVASPPASATGTSGAGTGRPGLQRHGTSVADLVKDFSGHARDTKSTQFPSGFMAKLEKRLAGVPMGTEKLPGYEDAVVRRTFAVFYNDFSRPDFRKMVDKDRRLEALVLQFFSSATKELQKTRTPGDESYKLMVDRYVALFVRLVSAVLKANDWQKDKPELANRLNTLEQKLLLHDQDLAASSQRNGGAGGMSIEVEVPRSGDVKDMPLVQVVASIFDRSFAQVQGDIDTNKHMWTDKAALQDLRTYQANLSLNTKRTLRSDDFDTEEAYETWRKLEAPDLANMMSAILQSNSSLASTSSDIQPLRHVHTTSSDLSYSDPSKLDNDSSYVFDQPVDMSALYLSDDDDVHSTDGDNAAPYVFIPSDPRRFYQMVLQKTLTYDLQNQNAASANGSDGPTASTLTSKRSLSLLRELRQRWRIPHISSLMLYLDVARNKFLNGEVDIGIVDLAFQVFKNPPLDQKNVDVALMFDRHNWTIKDYVLNQQILTSLHDAVLRDLFGELLNSFDAKPPNIMQLMIVLEEHIYDDPMFSRTPETLDKFTAQLNEALHTKAKEVYDELKASKLVATDAIEFYHIMELGKAVLKLCEKIQKRYRSTPVIMGVEPFKILVSVILPGFVADTRDLISSILHRVQLQGEEIPVLDGFELYEELVRVRSIHTQAIPEIPFAFNIETLLETFVWRWIAKVDADMLGWIEGAVKHDVFQVRGENAADVPSDADRHSVSVIDIFTSFKQSLHQIIELHWDDDYQYAKFMTALAKAFGGGISRYCELLDHVFMKEMDRLTPEREAALSRSRQERWMQLAKDTIAGKEKIEPFQFFPESFVKLNNIGYAMTQLDQLEKRMKVDECAAVIRKREPPATARQRRTENLVFTIKIIEAEDLAAGDANGLSDPYVVLGDSNRKRLAKTRVIYSTLCPRWDETIDITTQGPLDIVATVWDWDMMGDHDCLGRAAVKLDPSHFRDFLPREYWLDLDTQGRLLVRVSMEGEKDDIQFYFGKAFRMLKRTERDMTRKITEKLSAYIQHILSRRALKSMTSKGLSISAVSKYFALSSPTSPTPISKPEISKTLDPLFTYFNENFFIMKQTLTTEAMVNVMTRLWKEVLATIEALLVPPLSDKPSTQRQLSEQEVSIVFEWLRLLIDFFHAVDDDDPRVAHGVPLAILKSPKYHDLQNLNFFYFEPTDTLIRTSERMASQTQSRASARYSAPLPLGPSGLQNPSFLHLNGVTKRSKSIMLNRNLGTIRKVKEEKRKEAQAEPSDDVVLRILRMRPEAARYLKERSRQKEKLANAAAAEMSVRQSLLGRQTGLR